MDCCRLGENEQAVLDKLPSHWTTDPEIWSMADFEEVKEGDMLEKINGLITICENHVNNCEVRFIKSI